MDLRCPRCGSRNLRFSHYAGLLERLRSLTGVNPLRCRDCQHRFLRRTWEPAVLRYARCPRCWRFDLNTWTEERYNIRFWTRFRIKLGGHRWRCEYCRCNFVSFRKRREVWRRSGKG